MDQSQQHDMDGNGYSGSVARPYYPTEISEHEPMVTPSAHTHSGNYTGGRFPGEEVPDSQSGLPFNQNHNPYHATSLGESDKGYLYSGNLSSQGTPSGYESAVWTLQQNRQPGSQDRRMSDPIQAEGERILPLRQRFSDPILQNGWNVTWGPIESPGHMPAPFNGVPNALYQASYNVCPNCRHYPHVGGDPVYQPDQRDISPTMKWGFRDANCYFPRPPEENVPSNQQFSTQTSRFTTSGNERFVPSSSEHFNSGTSLPVSAAVNAADIPVTVGVGNHSANKGPGKKRKRKPREIKPRKTRTLTVEGKAHAKAVRDFPGGACEYCKRKKTKCTHRLPQDIPTESQDKRSPNTSDDEPPTPDHGPGQYNPRLYSSSQENDMGYQDFGFDYYDLRKDVSLSVLPQLRPSPIPGAVYKAY